MVEDAVKLEAAFEAVEAAAAVVGVDTGFGVLEADDDEAKLDAVVVAFLVLAEKLDKLKSPKSSESAESFSLNALPADCLGKVLTEAEEAALGMGLAVADFFGATFRPPEPPL